MDRAGEEVGAVLVVFLQSEVRLNQALQDLVAIGSQGVPKDGLVDLCGSGDPGRR